MNKGLVVVCVCFVGLGLATTWSRLRRAEPAPPGYQPQMYLYCPECGLEMTCPPDFEQRAMFCPHCLTRRLDVNAFSRNSGDGPRNTANGAVLAVAVGVPVGLAVAVYGASRLRAGREQGPEGDARRVACPGCGHKMKSSVFGPGATAVCPVCAEQFVVSPGAGQGKPAGDAADVREWGDWLGSELTKKSGGDRRPRQS